MKDKMKTWKDCPFYQEMYDIKHTWNEIECSQSILGKPEDCTGCPLLLGCKSDEMIPYQDKD